MKKNFRSSAIVTLILVYLVIVAGAMVRMTGSGMGCPDWPKCFGYYIPPTDIKELTWSANRDFEEGQVIIKDEKLLVATADFTTTSTFDETQWREYTKHDYAIFNPTHTWIEYLNRLIGALAGLATIVMAVFSIGLWKSNRKLTILSWLTVLMMGFQGWLGATVVYSVLNPLKITLHMIVALVIVAVLLYIISNAKGLHSKLPTNKLVRNVVFAALILTLIQIIIGTQVRQFVDEQVKILGYDNMQLVLANPELSFYVHRSLSILVFVLNVYLFFKFKNAHGRRGLAYWIMRILLLEILSGIAMYYFDFPFGTQAAHLVLASVLFGLQFYLLLTLKRQIFQHN